MTTLCLSKTPSNPLSEEKEEKNPFRSLIFFSSFLWSLFVRLFVYLVICLFWLFQNQFKPILRKWHLN